MSTGQAGGGRGGGNPFYAALQNFCEKLFQENWLNYLANVSRFRRREELTLPDIRPPSFDFPRLDLSVNPGPVESFPHRQLLLEKAEQRATVARRMRDEVADQCSPKKLMARLSPWVRDLEKTIESEREEYERRLKSLEEKRSQFMARYKQVIDREYWEQAKGIFLAEVEKAGTQLHDQQSRREAQILKVIFEARVQILDRIAVATEKLLRDYAAYKKELKELKDRMKPPVIEIKK